MMRQRGAGSEHLDVEEIEIAALASMMMCPRVESPPGTMARPINGHELRLDLPPTDTAALVAFFKSL
jgi:hypothetical protein